MTAAAIPARVLITGAAGFLGGALTRSCRTLWPEARIVAVDVRASDLVCDLTDDAAVLDLMRESRPDVLFHFAGLTGHASWEELWRANGLTLANVLDAALGQAPHCAVVVPGSAAEYGGVDASSGAIVESFPTRPRTPYAVSKAWQTTLARSYGSRGLRVTVGRLFNLCGAGMPATLVRGGGRAASSCGRGASPLVCASVTCAPCATFSTWTTPARPSPRLHCTAAAVRSTTCAPGRRASSRGRRATHDRPLGDRGGPGDGRRPDTGARGELEPW